MQVDLSPSKIAVLGLSKAGFKIPCVATRKLDHDTFCAACGTALKAGDLHALEKPGKSSFSDWQYMQKAISGTADTFCLCPDCAIMMNSGMMSVAQNCVITTENVWRVSSDAHRLSILRDPPEPPFIWVAKSTINAQHVVWRAPVTLDKDFLQIQIVRHTYTIDRKLLAKGENAALQCADIARDHGLKIGKHPFASLSRNMDGEGHGVVRHDVLNLAMKVPELAPLIQTLRTMGEGELLAMATTLKKNPVDPVREPLIAKG